MVVTSRRTPSLSPIEGSKPPSLAARRIGPERIHRFRGYCWDARSAIQRSSPGHSKPQTPITLELRSRMLSTFVAGTGRRSVTFCHYYLQVGFSCRPRALTAHKTAPKGSIAHHVQREGKATEEEADHRFDNRCRPPPARVRPCERGGAPRKITPVDFVVLAQAAPGVTAGSAT
jgi:hypothetical protein